MKIRFLTSVAGHRFAYRQNEEVELSPEVAREFLQARQAEIVREEAIETTSVRAPEAMRKRRRVH